MRTVIYKSRLYHWTRRRKQERRIALLRVTQLFVVYPFLSLKATKKTVWTNIEGRCSVSRDTLEPPPPAWSALLRVLLILHSSSNVVRISRQRKHGSTDHPLLDPSFPRKPHLSPAQITPCYFFYPSQRIAPSLITGAPPRRSQAQATHRAHLPRPPP